ncbi:MAG: HAD family hydrolase [Gammaproteobacteria bacterium]|nr:HAD family hydrolase [Gammaproteobacteria bacterium]MDE2250942.1 HAD family hydrolase [Gammaproteobacteria bacterium]
MAADPVRVAMWSGPRNISSAMMRSFGARPDTAVTDEPFYAAFLARSGADHPLRAEVLASQPNGWREVVARLLGPVPGGKPIWYQKQMTHHMLDEFGRAWLERLRNAFLIRDPRSVLASYRQIRAAAAVTLADIGIVQQRELFEREADRLGRAPPVIDGADVLADPPGMLARLCAALAIPYTDAMLSWNAGRRETDGVWAPAWYGSVERSTGFAVRAASITGTAAAGEATLPENLLRLAELARPHYEALAAHRLRAGVV